MDRQKALVEAQEMLPSGAKLLYLTKFGSHLYGTDTEESDHDFQGLFLPSLWDLVLMKNFKSCQYSTGSSTERNNSNDYDIQLWSIQYWLLTLMPKMDIVAMDLYFSHTNKEAVIYTDEELAHIFSSPEMFIDSDSIANSSYIRYALSQARKYGVKGTKLNMLMELAEFLSVFEQSCSSESLQDSRLNSIANSILEKFEGNPYLSMQRLAKNGGLALQVCGKQYPYYIRLNHFIKSIHEIATRYGKRAKQAAANEGIDWKALSHAVRAIHQAIELARTGYINFPLDLRTRNELIDIKRGKRTWDYVSGRIENGIDTVEKLQTDWYGKWTYGYAERIIWNLYKL